MNSLQLLFPLLEVLNDVFYPVLLDGPVSQHEVQLFALPARFRGSSIQQGLLLGHFYLHMRVPLYC